MSLDKRKLTEQYKEPLDGTKKLKKRDADQLRQSMEEDLAVLGIYINEQGFEKSKSGQPRFFEMAEDGTFKNALENGADVKSDAFLDKIAQGRVFAFPAGEKDPVQLSVKNGRAMTFSKQLKTIPAAPRPSEPQRPAPMRPWARFANWITRGWAYKQERAAYDANMDKYQKDIEQYQKDLARHQKETAAKENFGRLSETRTEADLNAEREKERTEEEREFAEARSKDFTSTLDRKIAAMSNYFSPNPKRVEAFTQKGDQGAPFTMEQFQQLTPIKITGVEVGGKQVTDDQFASLAICAALKPEYGGHVQYKAEEGRTYEQQVIHCQTMFTSDLMMIDDKVNGPRPRDNVGRYFDIAVQPGRQYAKQALDKYKAGDPTELGALIAYGIKFNQHQTQHKTLDKDAYTANDVAIGRTAELLENDPALMKAAEKAGLTQAEFNSAKGTKALADIDRENERAAKLLDLDAKANYTEGLGAQERADCVKSRLRYEAVNESINGYNKARQESEEYRQEREKLDARLEELMNNPVQDVPNASPEELEQLKIKRAEYNTKVNSTMSELDVYDNTHMGMPDVFEMAGRHGIKVVDQLSEACLPGQDKLLGLKGTELVNALESQKLFAKDSPYAQKPEKQPAEKTVEKAHAEPIKEQGI